LHDHLSYKCEYKWNRKNIVITATCCINKYPRRYVNVYDIAHNMTMHPSLFLIHLSLSRSFLFHLYFSHPELLQFIHQAIGQRTKMSVAGESERNKQHPLASNFPCSPLAACVANSSRYRYRR